MNTRRTKFETIPNLIDKLISILWVLIALLFLTGGAHFKLSHAKVEFSQIDAFGAALLALMVVRRWKFGNWLSDQQEKFFDRILAWVDANSRTAVTVSLLFYGVLHFWASAWRYDSFDANAYDLSYLAQPLWSTTRVGFLYSTLAIGHTYLGEHFSPILGLPAILSAPFSTVYFMFFFQTSLFVIGGYLVYLLARSVGLKSSLAWVVLVAYLVYQPVCAANTFDFREDNFYVPVFLGVLFAALRGRWFLFSILIALSWTVKENAPIFTALIGLWIALRREDRKRWQGLFLVAVSACVFWVVNSKITPMFSEGATKTSLVRRLAKFGGSNDQILSVVVRHPILFIKSVLSAVFQRSALKYIAVVLLPFAYFVPACLGVAAIALFGVFLNVVMDVTSIGFHYECVLIPFLFYTFVVGLKKKPVSAPVVLALFFVFAGRSPVDTIRRMAPSSHAKMALAALHSIPAENSVTAQSAIHPHLIERKDAYLFNSAPLATDYVVFDFHEGISTYGTSDLRADLGRLDQTAYLKVFDNDGLLIYCRKGLSGCLKRY